MPTIIYLIIFYLIVVHTPKNPILGFELADRGVMLKDYSLLFFSINEVAFALNTSYQVYLDFIFHRDYSLMALVVLGISMFILLYSSKFIESEATTRYNRYFLFLTVFISSMFSEHQLHYGQVLRQNLHQPQEVRLESQWQSGSNSLIKFGQDYVVKL